MIEKKFLSMENSTFGDQSKGASEVCAHVVFPDVFLSFVMERLRWPDLEISLW